MSDDAEQFYREWISIFNHKPKILVCIWHAYHAWCQKLNTISDLSIRAEVYSKLCLLWNETNEETFKELLQKIKNDFQEIGMFKKFYEYFETCYAKRCEQWAMSFRRGAFMSTNMYLEAFHKISKHIYLKRKRQ